MHLKKFLETAGVGGLVATEQIVSHLDADLPVLAVKRRVHLDAGETAEAAAIAGTFKARGFALVDRDGGKTEIVFHADRPAYMTPRPPGAPPAGPAQKLALVGEPPKFGGG